MAAMPLPDFTVAGRYLQQASTEIQAQFQVINHLPVIQLQEIMNQLIHIRETLVRLEAKVDRLNSKTGHQNTNSIARLQNTYCLSPTDHLTGLINPESGEAIPNMPADSESISHMNAPQIRAVLQQLGQVVPNNQAGGIALLRRQLRVQLGLRAEQAQGA